MRSNQAMVSTLLRSMALLCHWRRGAASKWCKGTLCMTQPRPAHQAGLAWRSLDSGGMFYPDAVPERHHDP